MEKPVAIMTTTIAMVMENHDDDGDGEVGD